MVTRLRECSGCMTLLSGSSELDSQESESGFKTPLNNESSFKILTLREFEKKNLRHQKVNCNTGVQLSNFRTVRPYKIYLQLFSLNIKVNIIDVFWANIKVGWVIRLELTRIRIRTSKSNR